ELLVTTTWMPRPTRGLLRGVADRLPLLAVFLDSDELCAAKLQVRHRLAHRTLGRATDEHHAAHSLSRAVARGGGGIARLGERRDPFRADLRGLGDRAVALLRARALRARPHPLQNRTRRHSCPRRRR